ncbi:MAG: transposase [Mesorhizobium sp.]|nr:MAG: transposase [Mesorhizobium sp.]
MAFHAHGKHRYRLWRADYNTARPHSQIAWQTPAEFASTFNPRRSLALRYAKGSAPAPVASPAQQGTTHAGNEPKLDRNWGQRHPLIGHYAGRMRVVSCSCLQYAP